MNTGVTINNGNGVSTTPFSSQYHYFAYHRVSTKKQHLDMGIAEINKFCQERGITLERDIFLDKQSGKTFNRERYIVLKEDVLRPHNNDVLMVASIDRLGRNKQEICRELNYYKENQIRIMILQLPTTLMEFNFDNELNRILFDTIQNILIELYSMMSHNECLLKESRSRAGIAAMKARGEWDRYGRPHAVTKEQFAETFEKVLQGVLKPCEAMRQMNISSPTYYRNKKEYEESKGKKVC